MKARAEIFGCLAVKIILAQTNAQKEMGLFEVYNRDAIRGSRHSYVCPHKACLFDWKLNTGTKDRIQLLKDADS